MEQDLFEALEWYYKAAEQGHQDALDKIMILKKAENAITKLLYI